MHPHLKYLIELQAVDFRLIEIRERLGRFPKQLAEVEARVATAKQQITTAKDALTSSLKDRKTYEMDVEQWKERAKKYRNQTGEVKSNEAYKALLHEIANAEDEIGKAEDRLLDRMVAGEEYERQVKAAEIAVKEIEAVANKDRQSIQAEYNAAQKQLASAEAARAAAVAAVPEDLVDHYERIAKRHGGIALAEIKGEGCGQCGVHIRPHVIQLLTRDGNEEFYHCETCTRILYYAAASAAPTSAGASASDSNVVPTQEQPTQEH
jgi:predicted  nucleic acid-binding Zn-ribbon protein